MSSGSGRKLFAPCIEEWVGRNDETVALHFSELREGRFDLIIIAGVQDRKLHTSGASARLSVANGRLGRRAFWIYEQGDVIRPRQQLAYIFVPLGRDLGV